MLRAGQAMVVVVLCLLTFGVVMVSSASLRLAGAEETGATFSTLIGSRVMWLALGAIVALVIGSWIPAHRLLSLRGVRSPVPWLILLMLTLLVLVHVPGIGVRVNGARRWLELGPVQFQPSEVAKWGILIVIAWHAVRRAGVIDRFWRGFLPPMVLVCVVCGLIATEDLGTATLIAVVSVLLLICAGARLRHAGMLLPLGLAGFAAAVIAAPYRIERLKTFVDPYADAQGSGYHIVQSLGAIHEGGLAGRGLGNSIYKHDYLPESTTDFVFSIVCEELGIAGAAMVVFLFACLLWCGLGIVKHVSRPFDRLLGLGILLTLGLQALINLMVVTAMAPTKGIALPLVSSGGTGWLMTAFFLGLLVRMDRDRDLPVEDAADVVHRPVKRLAVPVAGDGAAISIEPVAV